MEITKHQLKTWSDFFWSVVDGNKTFEIRFNDRDYQVDDYLELMEYCPLTEQYSGKKALFLVTYITDFQQKPGYVVMGIQPVDEEKGLKLILSHVEKDLGGKIKITEDNS